MRGYGAEFIPRMYDERDYGCHAAKARGKARARAKREIASALDACDEELPAESWSDGYCDDLSCTECGGLRHEHIEIDGPLRVTLLDVERAR